MLCTRFHNKYCCMPIPVLLSKYYVNTEVISWLFLVFLYWIPTKFDDAGIRCCLKMKCNILPMNNSDQQGTVECNRETCHWCFRFSLQKARYLMYSATYCDRSETVCTFLIWIQLYQFNNKSLSVSQWNQWAHV